MERGGTYVLSPDYWIAIGAGSINDDVVAWSNSIFATSDGGRLQTVHGPSGGRRVEPEYLSHDRNGVRHLGDVIQGDRLVTNDLVYFRSQLQEVTRVFEEFIGQEGEHSWP